MKLTVDLVHFGDRYGELAADVLESPPGVDGRKAIKILDSKPGTQLRSLNAQENGDVCLCALCAAAHFVDRPPQGVRARRSQSEAGQRPRASSQAGHGHQAGGDFAQRTSLPQLFLGYSRVCVGVFHLFFAFSVLSSKVS